MSVRRMLVTPKKAAEFLKKPNKNPVKWRAVERYAKEMTTGKWRETGEVILIDRDGVLQDGNHRMQAIVNSGMSFHFYVITGCDPADFHVINTGKKRGAADVLAIAGHGNYNQLSAVARLCMSIENGIKITREGVSPHEVLSYVEKHPDVAEYTEEGYRIYSETNQIVQGSLIGAYYYVFSRIDAQKASLFWGRFENLNGGPGCPAAALLRAFAKDATAVKKMSRAQRAGLIVRAWNAFYNGRKLKRLSVNDGLDNDRIAGLKSGKRTKAQRPAHVPNISA